MTTLHILELRADQTLHLGVGRGSGFSGPTHTYVPAPTLRGALAAAWWLRNPTAAQDHFDALIGGLSFTNAVIPLTDDPLAPTVIGLDRQLCKYRQPGCPIDGHAWWVTRCPTCHGRPEPARGVRDLERFVHAMTRVELSDDERALDDHLYEREGLVLGDGRLKALIAGDPTPLVAEGDVVRVGGQRSVSGRMTVTGLVPAEAVPQKLVGGHETALRVQLLTPGVYVDAFGRPVNRPSQADLRWSLGLADATQLKIERAFTRWTVAAGWHTRTNRPKPEDPAVVAHSCFHLAVLPRHDISVPSLVTDLGLRTSEGCGWAVVEELTDTHRRGQEIGHA